MSVSDKISLQCVHCEDLLTLVRRPGAAFLQNMGCRGQGKLMSDVSLSNVDEIRDDRSRERGE